MRKLISALLVASALVPAAPAAADPLDPVFEVLDPLTCETLRQLAPGWPPHFEIRSPDPDVYVFGEKFYDCPPYGN